MNNTAWNVGDNSGPTAAATVRCPPTRPRPRYSVVLALCGATHAADAIRSIVGRHRGHLEWLCGNQTQRATRMHLRLRAEHIYDIVTAFEAAGFDVIRVVTTGR